MLLAQVGEKLDLGDLAEVRSSQMSCLVKTKQTSVFMAKVINLCHQLI